MTILQINSVSNSGSTGKIAEGIAKEINKINGRSYIAFGRFANLSDYSTEIIIGNNIDIYMHGAFSILCDRHGFGSRMSTRKFLKKLDEINPDVIHLHNIHGYYINVELLFNYLAEKKKPVVWTLHDCWAFTGHCSYYMSVSCIKWKIHCHSCPQKGAYPKSLFIDNSRKNYADKKIIFNLLDKNNTMLVTPSEWLASQLPDSYLKEYKVKVINNGIDINRFCSSDTTAVREKFQIENQFVILGVANVWDQRKGLSDFIKLRNKLGNEYRILVVGLQDAQVKELPSGITGINRTESIEELAALYTLADVFFNPTYEDNFPTTNLEALACGTPVITYNTGGSPESVSAETGAVIDKGDLQAAVKIIMRMKQHELVFVSDNCRSRAIALYNQENRFKEYIAVYDRLINKV